MITKISDIGSGGETSLSGSAGSPPATALKSTNIHGEKPDNDHGAKKANSHGELNPTAAGENVHGANGKPGHGELQRLPGEKHRAYEAFLAWAALLSSGHPAPGQALASQLKVHVNTVYRWCSANRWQERMATATNTHVNASLQAAAETATVHARDWEEKREELRQVEWKLHKDLIETAEEALREWRASGQLTRPGEIARLIDLASRLGRLAAGMPTQMAELTGADGGPIQIDIEAALRKVYGTPAPAEAEVTDVEAEILSDPSPDSCPLSPDPCPPSPDSCPLTP